MQPKDKPIAIVAMGGHAFMLPGQKGTIEEHQLNAEQISEQLLHLVDRNYNLVITHGNGPQVVDIILRNDMAKNEITPMAMDVCDAESQGQIGYMIQQALTSEFLRRQMDKVAVSLITQVIVSEEDPAFQNPTKPIGGFMDQAEAQHRAAEMGWSVVEDAGRGWRRVVASPLPKYWSVNSRTSFQSPMSFRPWRRNRMVPDW